MILLIANHFDEEKDQTSSLNFINLVRSKVPASTRYALGPVPLRPQTLPALRTLSPLHHVTFLPHLQASSGEGSHLLSGSYLVPVAMAHTQNSGNTDGKDSTSEQRLVLLTRATLNCMHPLALPGNGAEKGDRCDSGASALCWTSSLPHTPRPCIDPYSWV